MKEYIKLFNTPADAHGYEIKDIPFICTIKSTGQNIICNEEDCVLNNTSGTISVIKPTIKLTLNDGSVVLITRTKPTQSHLSSYQSTCIGVNIYRLTSLENYLFANFSELTSVKIPNSVTVINNSTFSGCGKLLLDVPSTVTIIGDSAFWNVPNVNYTGSASGSTWGARSINGYVDGDLVFNSDAKTELRSCVNTSISSVTIPNSVTAIGAYAFYNCTSLSTATIPSSVTSILANAFRNSANTIVFGKLYSTYTNNIGSFTDVTIQSVDSGVNFISYDFLANIYRLTTTSTGTYTLRTENQALITAVTNSMSNYTPSLTINVYDLSGNLTATLQGTASNEINFTVDGVTYHALRNMTWQDFIADPTYNTQGWTTWYSYWGEAIVDSTKEHYIYQNYN